MLPILQVSITARGKAGRHSKRSYQVCETEFPIYHNWIMQQDAPEYCIGKVPGMASGALHRLPGHALLGAVIGPRPHVELSRCVAPHKAPRQYPQTTGVYAYITILILWQNGCVVRALDSHLSDVG